MTSLARWCSRWRFAVLGGWIVALVALAVVTLSAGTAFTDSTNLPDSEPAKAYSLLAQGSSADTEQGTIAWRTTGAGIDDDAVQRRITAMLDEVAALPGVESVVSPYGKAGAAQISAGSDTAYAIVVLDRDADTGPIIEAASDAAGGTVAVTTGGAAFTEQPGASHGTEAVGILAALAILLLVFRSGWAAALPIVTGLVGVAASLLLVMLGSHVVDLAATSLTMGALIGLGVGIDYALFIVNRYRKAVQGGASGPDAIAKSLDTSGRAVAFAGATVIVALLGMRVVNLGILTGMSQAAAVTVAFTVAAAITLLPALLAILGPRVLPRSARLSQPAGGFLTRFSRPVHRAGFAERWAALVQRAPLRLGSLAVVVIVALALPVTALRVGDADASSDPAGTSSHAYYEMMSQGFGDGFDATLLLVSPTPGTAFTALVKRLPSVPGVASVKAVPAQNGIAVATVTPATSAQTAETSDLVATLRNDVIPASGAEVYVGGTTATSIDLSGALMSKLPLYLGLIALLGFLLLAVAFRSLLVPLVGAISNVATIAVGLGVVTAIFQWGWGTELLGVGTGAPVMYLIPVLIVGIMFGLSMDYQVFLVSRMHEEWTHTHDNHRAVRTGVAETAVVIAAAATIMLSVFASFGFSGERIVSMIGIGLAIAVLVDALVVRLTLIPALMTLLGRANWYFPRWADKLTPKVSIEGPAPAETRDPVTVG
ncbi:MMPL family transporter [Winogradskya humida]|uniref:Membrane protein n=1 Tax=Winogradskya humida TaxID=113566 RepID=A0ABQ4A5D1_9ACTN|nr:MMPL family transporter [Actinoplanes humidus]GIE26057.1 membrane protein [Actinoplanes humidus]